VVVYFLAKKGLPHVGRVVVKIPRIVMAKDTKKVQYEYECELCGKTKPHLFAFCACDECDKMLRKHIAYYRNKRRAIEHGEVVRKRYYQNQKKKKGLLG